MKIISWIALIALFIGTSGLLINEFVFQWGSVATLIFAAFSALGLVILITRSLWNRTSQR